jgi:ERCC4-type nuclease
MAKKKPPKFVVIKDTREQKGWIFHKGDACDGMKLNALKTGDYTLEGFEDAVCIERKRSVEEIANNVGKEKKRFDAEMLRIQEYPFKYIICEFSMKDVIDYPRSIFSDYMWHTKEEFCEKEIANRKITGKYILRALMEYQTWYGIHILFCDSVGNAQKVTESIFKRLNTMFHE